MGIEHGNFNPEEVELTKKPPEQAFRLTDEQLKLTGQEALTEEQVQDLLRRMSEEQKPPNPDNEVR